MTDKLTSFLTRHHACIEVLARLAATGAATPEEAFERADDRDLVWAVTRPGVMSADQRRRFLSEAVLAPIEHLLTDARSLNILQKLRANEQITDADRLSAADAADDALADASDASYAAARAAWSAAQASAERASDAAAYAAAAAAVAKAEDADAADAARAAQAKWIRKNFRLADLRTN
jgi:hypothetical protein